MIHIKTFFKSLDYTALAVFTMLFITYSVLLPHSGHGWDIYCWKEWSKYIFQNGLGNVYRSGTDYLPLYHYVLFVFGKIQGSIEHIEQNIHNLKIITLIFDFTAGCLIYSLLKNKFADKSKVLIYSLFFFLNIAYFYNTLIWGQVDGIMATFILFSFYFALKDNITLSSILLLLGINLKLQAIIFLPLVGLILLPTIINRFSIKNLLIWFGIPFIIQILILLPFLLTGEIDRIWFVIKNSMGRYPYISMNAYNFWLFFFHVDFMSTKDSLKFLGLTLKSFGMIMFFTSSLFALFPLINHLIKNFIKKELSTFSHSKLLIIAALISLVFFFFNTQMHERYVHPAILFLAIYALLYNRYLPYVLVSIAYFLNLEDVFRYLSLHNYSTVIFTGWVISIVYLAVIIVLFYDLYNKQSINQHNYLK